jgi:hypothetical protein
VVENHQLLLTRRFEAGLSHSIGGPINNNIVILLERAAHHRQWQPLPYKPWGLPTLGKLKPKEITIESLLAGQGSVAGSFVTATTRFDFKSGAAQGTVVIVSCPAAGKRYRFLFGIGGEGHEAILALKPGDLISLERSNGQLLLNRLPVRRFYQKTFEGLVELAGSGWKQLTGKTPED